MSKVTYYISAYAIAVKHGFQGSEEEWLASLQGRNGKDGTVAWEELTPEQRAELVGPIGPQGPKGERGSDAEVNLENVVNALGYVPATKAEVKAAAPRNLLDNSDFTNPVNMEGAAKYERAGYTINRWYSKNSYPVELVAGGIAVTESIHQLVPEAKPGKRYTLAAKDVNGTVYMICEKPEDNVYHEDLEISSTAEGVSVRISGRTYRWAAMYDGEYTEETLPEYRSRGYGAEAGICRTVGNDGKGSAEYLEFENVTVQPGGFAEDETYEDYPFKARIALEGVKASMAPEVVFPVSDCQFALVCESYDGGVAIWADAVPDQAVTLPRITARRVKGR